MAFTYREAVDWLYGLERFPDDMTLDTMHAAMVELGHPRTAFDSVHIAGTNGKGSTAMILAAMLEEAGQTTGCYTSPHLVTPRERVRVDETPVSEETFAEVCTTLAELETELSFFEATTAAAFHHFAERAVDVAVVEAGLGGRLDATNVLSPACSVITNIAADHTAILGESPEQIAAEKAGIITDAPIVSGVTGTAADVIRDTAEAHGATYIPVEQNVAHGDTSRDGMTVTWNGHTIKTPLIGRFQCDNIATALTVRDVLGDVPDEAVVRALERIRVPGRMEVAAGQPLLVLDGAHNPRGMERSVETLTAITDAPVVAVVSIMQDKNHAAMLEQVERVADRIVLTEARMERAADPADLAEHCAAPTTVTEEPASAVEAAERMAGPGGTVFVTGSLYLVGNVKETL